MAGLKEERGEGRGASLLSLPPYLTRDYYDYAEEGLSGRGPGKNEAGTTRILLSLIRRRKRKNFLDERKDIL